MAVSVNTSDTINKKSRHDIRLMTQAGQIVAEVHALVRAMAKPGVTTLELDEACEAHIRKAGALPTFKGYHGFPATICASVNDEVVHGIPKASTVLKEGDILSLDVGATYRGLVADAAFTMGIGPIDEVTQRVLDTTEAALFAAIEQCVPGRYLEDVSGAIEDVGAQTPFGLVKEYGGHSVGHKLHEEPFIHNYRTGVRGPLLRVNNTLAIEPMFTQGQPLVKTLDDKWTVVTLDGLPSAHFEHTVWVSKDGPVILTRLDVVR
jgi:methionyl aminopeptidase